MIEVFGPTYRFNGEILTKPEIIKVADSCYDEENHCFHIRKLLENSACDPKEHVLIFDHINHDDELSEYHTISLPIFLAAEVKEFLDQNIQVDWKNKTTTFNFMINKPRQGRQFLLALIEHFDLQNYSHALAWKNVTFDKRSLQSTMKNELYTKIVDNVAGTIPVTDFRFGPEIAMDRGVKNGGFKNAETYLHLLKTKVFEPSCISLITESSFFEKETLHTEKTLMAFYGGTFPIWVGGWKLATYARQMGFDVFDDIVDHSYENYQDPWDRAYYAIEKNLCLLRDFDQAKHLSTQNLSRFGHNVDHLKSNPFLKDCLSKIERYQDPVRSELLSISKQFRYNCFNEVISMQLLGEEISEKGEKYCMENISELTRYK
jgi:Fe-S cluster assembly iron-binding protein IscA